MHRDVAGSPRVNVCLVHSALTENTTMPVTEIPAYSMEHVGHATHYALSENMHEDVVASRRGIASTA